MRRAEQARRCQWLARRKEALLKSERDTGTRNTRGRRQFNRYRASIMAAGGDAPPVDESGCRPGGGPAGGPGCRLWDYPCARVHEIGRGNYGVIRAVVLLRPEEDPCAAFPPRTPRADRRMGRVRHPMPYALHSTDDSGAPAVTRAFAIKRCALPLDDGAALVRVMSEIILLGTLAHPHVVPLRDVVMDTPAGVELIFDQYDTDLRALQTRLAPERADVAERMRAIVAQVLDGLAHMHDQDIIHRDIKPANILIRTFHAAPVRYQAIIGDLGMARSTRAPPGLVRQGAVEVQDPDFRAPEVWELQGRDWPLPEDEIMSGDEGGDDLTEADNRALLGPAMDVYGVGRVLEDAQAAGLLDSDYVLTPAGASLGAYTGRLLSDDDRPTSRDACAALRAGVRAYLQQVSENHHVVDGYARRGFSSYTETGRSELERLGHRTETSPTVFEEEHAGAEQRREVFRRLCVAPRRRAAAPAAMEWRVCGGPGGGGGGRDRRAGGGPRRWRMRAGDCRYRCVDGGSKRTLSSHGCILRCCLVSVGRHGCRDRGT